MNIRIRRVPSGVTLVELMTVMAIILVLVGMLLGPVHRAYRRVKAMDWESKGTYWKAEQQLRDFHSGLKAYPALTPSQLYELKAIDDEVHAFLKKASEYYPFSSETPPDDLVIRFAPSKDARYELYKSNLTITASSNN